MPKSKMASLSLSMPNPLPASDGSVHSASSSTSLQSDSPTSPNHNGHISPRHTNGNENGEPWSRVGNMGKSLKDRRDENKIVGPTSPTSPSFTSLPQFPTEPDSAPKHVREPSKSIFANLKASKSSTKIHSIEPTIRRVRQDSMDSEPPTEEIKRSLRHKQSSKKSLASNGSGEGSANEAPLPRLPNGQAAPDPSMSRRGTATSNTTEGDDAARDAAPLEPTISKSGKPKLPGFLKRTGSIRADEAARKNKSPPPIQVNMSKEHIRSPEAFSPDTPLTAPISEQHRITTFDDQRLPPPRNQSADRHPSPHSDLGDFRNRNKPRSREGPGHLNTPSQTLLRDGAGSHFLAGLKSTTSRAAEGLGKAGHRLIGRAPWRPNGNPGPHVEEDRNYTPKIIYLPLVDQTRITRIAKRLEDSKDKTEFWMPAVPWRCIDYLNYRGCEVEGLYRIPGGTRDIKAWEKRFDIEHDINLFDEPELYDINIIGSLFKRWLTNVPDYILPKEVQDRVASTCPLSETPEGTAPQLLKDELSKLPPWNYYLLFAITCHLSLLHAHADKNKMTFENLRICFAPALKMNGECFRWLVCDWRSCWQGCWTEKEYLEEEYRFLDQVERDGSSFVDLALEAAARRQREQAERQRELSERQREQPEAEATSMHSIALSGITLTEADEVESLAAPSIAPSVASAPRLGGSGLQRRHSLENGINRNQLGVHSAAGSQATLHARSASRLPELSLPQPISPIFTSEADGR